MAITATIAIVAFIPVVGRFWLGGCAGDTDDAARVDPGPMLVEGPVLVEGPTLVEGLDDDGTVVVVVGVVVVGTGGPRTCARG